MTRDEQLVKAALDIAAKAAEDSKACERCGACFVAADAVSAIDPAEVLAGLSTNTDAVAGLWHAARLGLDMARANDLTNTAAAIMEAMNAVKCPCRGSDEMCPCQNRRPQPTPDLHRTTRDICDEVEALRAENERMTAERVSLAQAAKDVGASFRKALDRAEKAEAENERLRAALKPFADYMHTDEGRLDLDHAGCELPDDLGVGWIYLNHGDFRRARAALAQKGASE